MKPAAPNKQRLHIVLPDAVADKVTELASGSGRSKTEVVRMAIGIFAALTADLRAGNRIFIHGPDGSTPVKELVLPQ